MNGDSESKNKLGLQNITELISASYFSIINHHADKSRATETASQGETWWNFSNFQYNVMKNLSM